MLLHLPPMPSFGNEVTIGLVSSQLVGDSCFASVPFLWMLAGGTGVAISNVKSVRPTVVLIGVESGAPVASGGSDAALVGGLVGGPVCWCLDGC